MEVKEVSLTGNMEVEEMNARHIKWQTESTRKAPASPADEPNVIYLQPQ